MGEGGCKRNPEYVIKSDLKDKTLYCPNEFVHDCSWRQLDIMMQICKVLGKESIIFDCYQFPLHLEFYLHCKDQVVPQRDQASGASQFHEPLFRSSKSHNAE